MMKTAIVRVSLLFFFFLFGVGLITSHVSGITQDTAPLVAGWICISASFIAFVAITLTEASERVRLEERSNRYADASALNASDLSDREKALARAQAANERLNAQLATKMDELALHRTLHHELLRELKDVLVWYAIFATELWDTRTQRFDDSRVRNDWLKRKRHQVIEYALSLLTDYRRRERGEDGIAHDHLFSLKDVLDNTRPEVLEDVIDSLLKGGLATDTEVRWWGPTLIDFTKRSRRTTSEEFMAMGADFLEEVSGIPGAGRTAKRLVGLDDHVQTDPGSSSPMASSAQAST